MMGEQLCYGEESRKRVGEWKGEVGARETREAREAVVKEMMLITYLSSHMIGCFD